MRTLCHGLLSGPFPEHYKTVIDFTRGFGTLPPVSPPSREELAMRTIDRAKDALRSGRGVGLPELLKLIQTLSSNIQGVDVAMLANVIQKDAVILAKVLSTAQTLAYNVTGARITSVAQAIHVIGYGRIRTLTMSLLIADAAGSRPATEEHRQAAATAICSGFMAEAVAQEVRLCDREEAFIGACLRNLGAIVMASFMHEDYRAARAVRSDDPDEGWRTVFGVTPLELGREILRREHAPEEVAKYLEDCRPESFDPCSGPGPDPLVAVCDFSARVAEVGLQAGTSGETAFRQMKALATRFGTVLPDLEERMGGLLNAAGEQLREFMRDRRISSLPEGTIGQFSRRAEAFARLSAEEAKSAAAGEAHAEPAPAPPPPPDTAEIWQHALERLERLFDQPKPARTHVLAYAVELLRGGFAASDVLVLSGRGPAGQAVLTAGAGELFLRVPPTAAAGPAERTVTGVCLKYRENVLIHDALEPKITPHLPEWLKADPILGSFALFPLIGSTDLCGVVLVGWREARPLVIGPIAAAALAKFLHRLAIGCEQL